jgi:hypothetical protein
LNKKYGKNPKKGKNQKKKEAQFSLHLGKKSKKKHKKA